MVDPLDYRFGQERIGPGDPDTRPCVARITAKAAGVFQKVEPVVLPTPLAERGKTTEVTESPANRRPVIEFVPPPLRPDYKRKWE